MLIYGVDLIRRLETYMENDYLKTTTHLCTFDYFHCNELGFILYVLPLSI